jgi:chromosome segregation ATPase
VELSLAKATLELDQLSAELEANRARTNALQTELNDLQSRLEASRRREADFDREISDLREQRRKAERETAERTDAVVAEAERRAAAIRTDGLRQVAELQQQVEELLTMRAGLTQALQSAVENVEVALSQTRAAPARMLEAAPEPSESADAPEHPQQARWSRDPAGHNPA